MRDSTNAVRVHMYMYIMLLYMLLFCEIWFIRLLHFHTAFQLVIKMCFEIIAPLGKPDWEDCGWDGLGTCKGQRRHSVVSNRSGRWACYIYSDPTSGWHYSSFEQLCQVELLWHAIVQVPKLVLRMFLSFDKNMNKRPFQVCLNHGAWKGKSIKQ